MTLLTEHNRSLGSSKLNDICPRVNNVPDSCPDSFLKCPGNYGADNMIHSPRFSTEFVALVVGFRTVRQVITLSTSGCDVSP